MSLSKSELEAFSAITALEERIAELESPWIKVADNLPDDNRSVFVKIALHNQHDIDNYNVENDKKWYFNNDVIEWMEIPK